MTQPAPTQWKRRDTSADVRVEVDLDAFDTEQLLQELIHRKILTEGQAFALAKRESKGTFDVGADDIEMARTEIMRGRRSEALIYIERALGHEFMGKLA